MTRMYYWLYNIILGICAISLINISKGEYGIEFTLFIILAAITGLGVFFGRLDNLGYEKRLAPFIQRYLSIPYVGTQVQYNIMFAKHKDDERGILGDFVFWVLFLGDLASFASIVFLLFVASIAASFTVVGAFS